MKVLLSTFLCIKPAQDHERAIVTHSSDTHLVTHTVTPARHPRIPAPLALHMPVLLEGRSREPQSSSHNQQVFDKKVVEPPVNRQA
jgi:hypothetical protein